MAWLRRKSSDPELPQAIRDTLVLERGERVLASAPAEDGTWVLVTTTRLYAAAPAGEPLARPWHLVDGGKWDHDAFTLTVTWVDGAKPQQWVFRESMQVLAAFRERVQASVVLTEQVPLGTGRSARVVIRKNLADGSMHDQTLLGKGVRLADPGVAQAVADARARLREQVGLI
ncbi:hypothetical protein [Nostocoides veronense]|uniref:Uncharacterized protein n=1 Tax=Nostocoides veronense TaxID=330836 RepID=A0ABP4Y1E6_9MICO